MLKIGQIFKKYQIKKNKENDIIYWKGHVALALSNKKLIHAYGPMKKTVVIGIKQTIKRIEDSAKLKVIGIKSCKSKGAQSPSTALKINLNDSGLFLGFFMVVCG